MKTLAEHEEELRRRYERQREGWIGLACDHCGHELRGSKFILASMPPQQDVWCNGCGWKGRRTV